MSPENMTEENTLKYGARLILAPDTKVELLSLTKKEFYARNPYLTGNTKNTSPQVLVCFLDHNMNASAAIESGLLFIKGAKAVLDRVKQIVTKDQPYSNYYLMYVAYKKANFIRPTLRDLLDPENRHDGALSESRIELSVALARGAVAHYGSIKEAAEHTNVPIEILRYWLKVGELK